MKALIGNSPVMSTLRAEIIRAAQAQANVLVLGETGVGKELVARALHDYSGRHRKPYVTVDCGTLTDELAASELFGYKRGAFTGATSDHEGLLVSADGGTLFLDEIGNLTVRVQGMLLRTLQEQRVRRVGDHMERPIDVRVLSATNRKLEDGFRQDLLYRLNTLTISVPPLRKRDSDIPILARSFVEQLNARYQRKVTLSRDAAAHLQTYDYPGNVRELEQLIHRAYLVAKDDVRPEHCLLPTLTPAARVDCRNFWQDLAGPLHQHQLTRAQVETAVRQGLQATGGSYKQLLGHFGLPASDYKRFMDFLRRYRCNPDYRQYRK